MRTKKDTAHHQALRGRCVSVTHCVALCDDHSTVETRSQTTNTRRHPQTPAAYAGGSGVRRCPLTQERAHEVWFPQQGLPISPAILIIAVTDLAARVKVAAGEAAAPQWTLPPQDGALVTLSYADGFNMSICADADDLPHHLHLTVAAVGTWFSDTATGLNETALG